MPSTLCHSLSLLALLSASISANAFDCGNIVVDKQKFNLSPLAGPKSVHHIEYDRPSTVDTTYTIDICAPLKRDDQIAKKDQCDSGTRVCAIERDTRSSSESEITRVFNIAGEYTVSGHGGHLDARVTRLKTSESDSDTEQEGIRAVLNGGVHMTHKQRAIVEFICDRELTGNEGFEDAEKAEGMIYGRMGKRDDEEEGDGEGDDDDDDAPKLPHPDEGKSLQYGSYDVVDNIGILRLTWNTKYACEGAKDESPGEDKKAGGWGFFTWLLIIVFLLAAAYIIFGSWLNYNRYGARGWDLLPHGDAIRDLPYVIKDLYGNVRDKLSGSGSWSGGSRGGYSAV